MPRAKKSPLEKLMKRNATPMALAGATAGVVEASDEQRLKAFELRLQHKSHREIANELGVNAATVCKWLNHVHEKKLHELTQAAGRVRDEMDQLSDDVIARWAPLALHEDLKVQGTKYGKNGELKHINIETWEASAKATELLLKAMEGKSKRHGLGVNKLELPKDDKGNVLPLQIQAIVHALVQQPAGPKPIKGTIL